MSIDDDIEAAIGSPFGLLDTDDVRDLFGDRQGHQLVRVVCGLCGNREIASIRRIRYHGEDLLVAGRYEDVAIHATIVRRILTAHDAPDDPRNGRRRVPHVLIVEPAARPITGWCRRHGHFDVPRADVERAIQLRDSLAPNLEPPTVRVGAAQRRPSR